jgi:hypothetical protein
VRAERERTVATMAAAFLAQAMPEERHHRGRTR